MLRRKKPSHVLVCLLTQDGDDIVQYDEYFTTGKVLSLRDRNTLSQGMVKKGDYIAVDDDDDVVRTQCVTKPRQRHCVRPQLSWHNKTIEHFFHVLVLLHGHFINVGYLFASFLD